MTWHDTTWQNVLLSVHPQDKRSALLFEHREEEEEVDPVVAAQRGDQGHWALHHQVSRYQGSEQQRGLTAS